MNYLCKAIKSNNEYILSNTLVNKAYYKCINMPTSDGLTPIWYMYKNNDSFNENILTMLVDNGVIIDYPNKDQQTLLMYCIEKGYTKMAISLIKNDCELNYVDKAGMSALHYAVYNLDYEMIETLIECGIDINIPD